MLNFVDSRKKERRKEERKYQRKKYILYLRKV